MKIHHALLILLSLFTSLGAQASALSALDAKLDDALSQIQRWATDPEIVAAVTEHNRTLPPEHSTLDQGKWSALSPQSPLIRAFTKNAAAQRLAAHRAPWVLEAFVSDVRGLKVAFLSKPTNWSHFGKPKHDVPMSGKCWRGKIETDESTQSRQIQIAVPILDGDQPIGSLVVGIGLSELAVTQP